MRAHRSMRRAILHICGVLVALIAAALPAAAGAAPAPPPPIAVAPAIPASSTVDAATRRILELQGDVADVQDELVSLDNRIAISSARIVQQQEALDRAHAEQRQAQDSYDGRVIGMYKFGGYDSLALLLDSESFADFVSRLTILSRILEIDRVALQELSVVAAQAEYQAGQLEELRRLDVEMRGLKEERQRVMNNAQAEMQSLLAGITAPNRAIVDQRAAAIRAHRDRWKAASVPAATRIRPRNATVRPYTDRTYRSSPFHFTTYRTTGVQYRAVATWYGADLQGKPTGSGQVFNMDDFTCAHRTLPFGTWLALSRYDTKAGTYRRIIVVVNDRGPYTKGRDLELSRAAAEALGIRQVGSGEVSVEVVNAMR